MSADPYSSVQVRSQVRGIVSPPLSVGPEATLAALLDELDRTQWLGADALRELQFRQLQLLAGHCAAHSPQFGARLRAAGLTPADMASRDGLSRLPILRRREVQDACGMFCGEVPPAHHPVTETRTSGSTGEPVRVLRTAITELMWLALTVRDQLWHRRDFRGRLCSIRATTDRVLRFASWGGPIGSLFETGEILVIPAATALAEQLALIDEFRPETLLSYPSQLVALIAECRARDAPIVGLKHVRTLGETLSPALREDISGSLGARVADNYSAQEIGCIAIECPDCPGTYHAMSETVVVELLREDGTACEVGETGRVVVTDLHNLATPMIRYDMGDYAEWGEPCPCGRGLPVLRRIAGRERNLVRLPDGRGNWPWFGHHFLRDVAPVRQIQVIQHSLERIEVRLLRERQLTASEEAAVRASVAAVLGHPFAMDLHYFDERLPVGANGKFDEFVCLIGRDEAR